MNFVKFLHLIDKQYWFYPSFIPDSKRNFIYRLFKVGLKADFWLIAYFSDSWQTSFAVAVAALRQPPVRPGTPDDASRTILHVCRWVSLELQNRFICTPNSNIWNPFKQFRFPLFVAKIIMFWITLSHFKRKFFWLPTRFFLGFLSGKK